LAADIVTTRMRRRAPDLRVRIDVIGRDSTFGSLAQDASAAPVPSEIRLRFAAQSMQREPVELLLNEVEALYCAGPAGGCGVRRHLSPRLASASCLIERERVAPRVTFVGDGP
jgi:hypothetical protein